MRIQLMKRGYTPIMKLIEGGQVYQTLIRIMTSNVREPDQLGGDVYALANCNEISKRRLIEMKNGLAALYVVNAHVP